MANQTKSNHSMNLVTEECYTCRIPILMTKDQRHQFDEEGMTIRCVLGHRTVRRESENQRLRRNLADAYHRIIALGTQRDHQRFLLDAETKRRKALEVRVRNGVCPACKRSFQNVRRHIARMHPVE